LSPWPAAERGSIDAVIDPADTRSVVCNAIALLEGKQERLPARRHDNSPL
jgi:propionyl-CoA carboxylase beta chain